MQYGIGLDIGIASVGWAVVALDSKELPCGILGMGSRVFSAAEQPKTGASLAAPRREARSARRRLRRHRHRNERIRELLLRTGLLTQDELSALFAGRLEDIYALRIRALDEPVTNTEFARILIHLAQRRGFRSNRKNASSKEDGELLAAVTDNQRRMDENGYRTVGEMFLKHPDFAEHKRNKGGNYLATVTRDHVEHEARAIFSAQREFGVVFATTELEEAYLGVLLSQRSFDEGPGGNSPYGGDQIERMVGKCTFLPDEPRAAKATYSFEYFTLLEKINHIRLLQAGKSLPLNPQQRRILIDLAHKTENLDFGKIRKALSPLPPDCTFNMVRYDEGEDTEACEKKTKFQHLRAYHQMRKAFDKLNKGYLDRMPRDRRNAIAKALTLYKTSKKITESLTEQGLEPLEIQVAEELGSFSRFGHLSVKALDAIIPHLESGMRYDEACTAAGFQFRGHDGAEKDTLLHPTAEDYADITSPVARRAISQTIKVINAIIRKQGQSPVFINIELAREMARDFSERKQMERRMAENQAENQRIMDRLRSEFGVSDPTGQDLIKLRLYEQQGGVCPYSQKQISLVRLFEANYAEVDHIIPYSISFDDTRANKVLVLAAENRDKGPRLPLQYLTGKRRDDFIVWVNGNIRDRKKRQLLLKESITAEDEGKFIQRNLQDTQTMARFLLNYVQDNLLFAESVTGKKKRVTAVNGAVTSYMRKRWGINKIRANGDLHHAVDALVIACTTDGMIQQISRHSRYKECQYSHQEENVYAVDGSTGEVLRTFPYPWPQFRKELEGHLSSDPARFLMDQRLPMYAAGEIMPPQKPIFVSRMPTRKVRGAAHEATILSPKQPAENWTVAKVPLTKLKLKDGEIVSDKAYAIVPKSPSMKAPLLSDPMLYEALKQKLMLHGGNGEIAFADGFRKPRKDGLDGPLVKHVKLLQKTSLSMAVNNGNGRAKNDSMVRVDVFYVENDGYYLVPIYVADTLKLELPNKACVSGKPYSQWKEMRKEDFLFSLYKDDLLYIEHREQLIFHVPKKLKSSSTLEDPYPLKKSFAYFVGMDIDGAKIDCVFHHGAYELHSLGVKKLLSLQKYTVDVLGEYHPVGKEVRQDFSTMKRDPNKKEEDNHGIPESDDREPCTDLCKE